MKEMVDYRSEVGKPVAVLICGSLVYYHCAHRNSSLLSLVSDVFIVLLCSLAILGLLFRQMNVSVPVDPLEWQISQDTANSIVAWLANTVGAAESVLRVAATGHDKRLFFKVVFSLYMLSALGRLISGLTVAYIVDPLEWQISQDTANSIVAWLANTVGAAESVLRVAATGHDKRLFFKVVFSLYMLSALGRLISGLTVASTGTLVS